MDCYPDQRNSHHFVRLPSPVGAGNAQRAAEVYHCRPGSMSTPADKHHVWKRNDAHLSVPLPGLFARPGGVPEVLRRPADHLPILWRCAAQSVQLGRYCVQRLGLLRHRFPAGLFHRIAVVAHQQFRFLGVGFIVDDLGLLPSLQFGSLNFSTAPHRSEQLGQCSAIIRA